LSRGELHLIRIRKKEYLPLGKVNLVISHYNKWKESKMSDFWVKEDVKISIT
jgi:hypothetical protein